LDCTKTGSGSLPLAQAFLTIDNKEAILSTYKRNEDGMNILRIYNSADISIEVPIHFKKSISEAYVLNLNEEIIENLNFSDQSIMVTLEKAQILTIGTK